MATTDQSSMQGLAQCSTCQILVFVTGEDRFSCDVNTINRNSQQTTGADIGREGDVAMKGVAAAQRHVGGEGDACQRCDPHWGSVALQEGSVTISARKVLILLPDLQETLSCAYLI